MDETVYGFKTEWKPGGEVRVFLSAQKERLENFEPESHELKRFEVTENVRQWEKEDFETVDENFKATRRTYYYVDERGGDLKIVDHVHDSQHIESMIQRNNED